MQTFLSPLQNGQYPIPEDALPVPLQSEHFSKISSFLQNGHFIFILFSILGKIH
jgi:hypothetical protein